MEIRENYLHLIECEIWVIGRDGRSKSRITRSVCVYEGILAPVQKEYTSKMYGLVSERFSHPPSTSGILVLNHEVHSTENGVPGEVDNIPSIVIEDTERADQPPKGGDLIRISHQLLHRPARLFVQHVTELGGALLRWERTERGKG